MEDSPAGLVTTRSSRALWALAAVAGLHFALLMISLPDYFADNDLGYHISLARQYALHGTYFWDHLNWAPTGRPNLQGPLLHFSIGMLGRLLGGGGDQYVLAYSLQAVLQWAAAVFTTIFFARRFGGDWAALFAGALLAGSIWSAAPFFVGVPSGWIFIGTAWAIHFFLAGRYGLSALFTTLVVYVHLGGASTAPLGVLLAAVITRRWRGLIIVGCVTALATAPYTLHFLRHLEWYTGRRGHVAGSVALLTYVLAVPGMIWLMRRPRQNAFLLLWAVAPVAWLFQDPLRFLLQSTVAASAVAGVVVAWLLERWQGRAALHARLAAGLVLLATLFPLSIPSLPVEFAWATGRGFPRELDWREVRALASVFARYKLNDRIVTSYYDSLSAAMAIYTDLRQEYGHWGEVRPARNPAEEIPVGERVFLIPVSPRDPKMEQLEEAGLLRCYGGSQFTSIVMLEPARPPEEVSPTVANILHEEATWLAAKAVNNTLPPVADLFSKTAIAARRRRMAAQKAHAGLIQLAYLIYAHSQQKAKPELASAVRRGARGWGGIANFIGDETAIDYLSQERFERFRENLAAFAQHAQVLHSQTVPSTELDAISNKLFDEFF